jgi:hypothetical protein
MSAGRKGVSIPTPFTQSSNSYARIAIVPLTVPAAMALQKPYSRREAATQLPGLRDSGGAFGPSGGNGTATGEGALIGLAALPVVMLVEGGIAAAYGALKGESAAKLQAALPVMRNTLAEVHFETVLQERLASSLHDRTGSQVVLTASRVQIHPAPADYVRNFYSDLAALGIQTVLEIEIEQAALNGRGVINPPLALNAKIRLRVIRLRDGQEMDYFDLQYQGRGRKFVDWAHDNAKPFRDELERCYQTLVEQMTNRLSSL